jgi:hypothetical protein
MLKVALTSKGVEIATRVTNGAGVDADQGKAEDREQIWSW